MKIVASIVACCVTLASFGTGQAALLSGRLPALREARVQAIRRSLARALHPEQARRLALRSNSEGMAQRLAPLDETAARPYAQLKDELRQSLGPAVWQRFQQMELTPVKLKSAWIGEDKPGFQKGGHGKVRDTPVLYLARPEQRAPFELTIQDGKLYRGGQLFGTGVPESMLILDPTGKHLYGMETDEPLVRATTQNGNFDFAHSTFLAGGRAIAPGEHQTNYGVVWQFKNRSGHYRPSRLEFVRFLLELEARGLDISRATVEFDPKSKVGSLSSLLERGRAKVLRRSRPSF